MKYILIALLVSLRMLSYAQDVPKPDFANQPMIWNKADNSLTKLKKENVGMKGKMKGAFYTFDGTESSARVNGNNGYSFLIQSSMQMDPSSITTLYHLTVKGKLRQAEMAGKSGAFSTNMSTATKDVLSYDLKKLSDDVYEIVISEKLAPGEYAFVVGGVGYTFGIDG